MKRIINTRRRIIRCIRIDPILWEDTRNAAKEGGTYISHLIEGLLKTFLLDKTINTAVAKGSNQDAVRTIDS